MRLFFALWPSELGRQQLAALAFSCGEHVGGGRVTRSETIHLTLAFLGEVPEARLSAVIEAGRAIHLAPFDLRIDSLGYWRHNRLLWAGCALPNPPLLTLVEELRSALTRAGLVFDGNQQSFVPHLSLVRKVPDAGGAARLPDMGAISWLCTGFALVESQSTSTGSHYRTIAEFPLRG